MLRNLDQHWLPDDSSRTPSVVVAGPGSDRTIPGLMAAEVVHAVYGFANVTRLEIDPVTHFRSGLHRAPALASLNSYAGQTVPTYQVQGSKAVHRKAFARHIVPGTSMAIAVSWSTIDANWVGDFVAAAKRANAVSVVLDVSSPNSPSSRMPSLAREVAEADLVLMGDPLDANLLSGLLRSDRPVIETHRGLSLSGRSERPEGHRITAFLPKDDTEGLRNVLTAFDAIPRDWSGDYHLCIVMRHTTEEVPRLLGSSFYADRIQLVDYDLTTRELERLSHDSSAIIIADPAFDSRAYAMAEACGVPTVIVTEGTRPSVGPNYLGGLLADVRHPASIYVAQMHALRLADLNFPTPQVWAELGLRLRRASHVVTPPWGALSSSFTL